MEDISQLAAVIVRKRAFDYYEELYIHVIILKASRDGEKYKIYFFFETKFALRLRLEQTMPVSFGVWRSATFYILRSLTSVGDYCVR